jgi:CarboxypepD_reg-like domain
MKKQGLLLAVLLCFNALLCAQKTVSGQVVNEKGEPLVGASIVIKDTQLGTLSDENGQYQLTLPKEADTLVYSFVGFAAIEKPTLNEVKMDVAFSESLCFQEVTIVAYNSTRCCCCSMCGGIESSFCCGCRCLCLMSYESWNYPISATPLSNGATKLTYSIDILRQDKSKDGNNYFKNKRIKYNISKSIDDINYKWMGNSHSDTTFHLTEKQGTTQIEWGGSQFLDRTLNKADTTFYLVEGYTVDVDEYGEEEEVSIEDRKYVYREKIKVLPSETLKITNVDAPPQSKQVELDIFSCKNELTDFKMVDRVGRVVLSHQQVLFKEQNRVVLTYNDLASGLYILSVVQGEQVDVRKFLIVK